MNLRLHLLNILDLHYTPYYRYISKLCQERSNIQPSDKTFNCNIDFPWKNKLLNQRKEITTTPTIDTEKLFLDCWTKCFQKSKLNIEFLPKINYKTQ